MPLLAPVTTAVRFDSIFALRKLSRALRAGPGRSPLGSSRQRRVRTGGRSDRPYPQNASRTSCSPGWLRSLAESVSGSAADGQSIAMSGSFQATPMSCSAE